MKFKRSLIISTVAISALVLSGCGSSGESGKERATGAFVDAPVDNISYKCSSGKTGITHDLKGLHGIFDKCLVGDSVSFSFGGIELGSTDIKNETPVVGVNDIVKDTKKLKSVVMLINTLDTDGDTSNGITLPQPTIQGKVLNELKKYGIDNITDINESNIKDVVDAAKDINNTWNVKPCNDPDSIINELNEIKKQYEKKIEKKFGPSTGAGGSAS